MRPLILLLSLSFGLLSCASKKAPEASSDQLIGFWKFDKLMNENGELDKGQWSIRSLSLQDSSQFVLITEKEVIEGNWTQDTRDTGDFIVLKNARSSDGPKDSEQAIEFKLESNDSLVLIFPGKRMTIEAYYYRHQEDK